MSIDEGTATKAILSKLDIPDRTAYYRKYVFRCVLAVMALIVVIGIHNKSRAAQASTEPDWKARFLAEAPTDWLKLEAVVGRWEVRSDGTDIPYNLSASGVSSPQPAHKGFAQFSLDARINGMRVEFTPFPDDGYRVIDGSNNQYHFEVERNSPQQQFRLTQYSLTNGKNWAEMATGYKILAAEELSGARLSKYVSGQSGYLKSATPVQIDGKRLVRLDFDRLFPDSHKPYPCWAIVDPDFHWAIVSFQQVYAVGTIRENVEYQTDIKDVAFPKHVVETQLDRLGNIRVVRIVDIGKPQPCKADPKEFMLESVGLEPPRSGLQQPAPTPPLTTSRPEQSGASGPSTADPSASTPSNAEKSAFGFFTTHLGMWALGVGILFYILFLRSRHKGAIH